MRADGRKPDQLRDVSFTMDYIPPAEGSVLIAIGNTRVICNATIEDKVPPFMKGSGSGWVTAEYSMLPRATDVRTPRESSKGKVGGRTHEIQRLIGRSMRSVVDLKGLGERTIWIDCDVIQADGGTRTASITGAYLCLAHALRYAMDHGMVSRPLLMDHVAAISVGIVGGKALLDLNYGEDFEASVDMNLVMTGQGRFIEVQGTAEGDPFRRSELDELLGLGENGIKDLVEMQKAQMPEGVLKL
ncbi:MAG: ribonuclease PH [Thermodesulfovibrionales bacterium]|nr:ribonuclease PH [Thermodesulfovibrionales bacterium]